MLTKVDEKLLTAVMGLGASGTLTEVVKFLSVERARLHLELETAKGDYLLQVQGRAQFAKELLEVLGDPATLMTKLKAGKAQA